MVSLVEKQEDLGRKEELVRRLRRIELHIVKRAEEVDVDRLDRHLQQVVLMPSAIENYLMLKSKLSAASFAALDKDSSPGESAGVQFMLLLLCLRCFFFLHYSFHPPPYSSSFLFFFLFSFLLLFLLLLFLLFFLFIFSLLFLFFLFLFLFFFLFLPFFSFFFFLFFSFLFVFSPFLFFYLFLFFFSFSSFSSFSSTPFKDQFTGFNGFLAPRQTATSACTAPESHLPVHLPQVLSSSFQAFF